MEIQAAYRALQTFYRIHKTKSVLLKIDNKTAIAYIANKGGKTSQPMNQISKEIWKFATSNNINITVEYIPSKLNIEADQESRLTDSSEWKLNPNIFSQITKKLGQPDIDLFASLATKQIQQYVSYKPDPKAVAVDAFQMKWTHKFIYAFPPFKIIGRVLNKISLEHVTGIIITPTWTTATWYPQLLQNLIHNPILLPQSQNLLKDPAGNIHPMLENNKLRLAAWLVSSNPCKIREYHQKLHNSWQSLGHQEQIAIMKRPGINSIAGVSNNNTIAFDAL